MSRLRQVLTGRSHPPADTGTDLHTGRSPYCSRGCTLYTVPGPSPCSPRRWSHILATRGRTMTDSRPARFLRAKRDPKPQHGASGGLTPEKLTVPSPVTREPTLRSHAHLCPPFPGKGRTRRTLCHGHARSCAAARCGSHLPPALASDGRCGGLSETTWHCRALPRGAEE